jgi:ATP-dependent Lon protease
MRHPPTDFDDNKYDEVPIPEWLFHSDLTDTLRTRAEELIDVPEATLDDEGCIECPALPLRDMVLFPRMVTPLLVGREKSLAAIAAANANHETVVALAQFDPEDGDPGPDDLYQTGCEVAVGRMLRMPDGTTSVMAQGRCRVEVIEFTQTEPYYRVKARPIYEPAGKTIETEALMRAVLALFEKVVNLNRSIPEEAYVYAMNVDEAGWLADMVTSTLKVEVADGQTVLEIADPIERLQRVSVLLGKELDVLELEDHITSQVQSEVDKNQREYYLREKMKAIQSELGEGDLWVQEISELRDKVQAAALPDEANKAALKELERLQQMPPMSPETGIIRTYLDWLIELPWHQTTTDNLDLAHAKQLLDDQHFGLPKAKDRILEYMAVRSLAADKMRSPILCFVGPPGTGKTSLGQSIANALGRKFVRVSLGGVRDEAEIRGHRRTYIGALPGRILQTMRRAGTVNPLIMLDEIDKLSQDFRGDPSAALLEVLDPEQNHAFLDHYLDVSYNLSKVLFVTTANYLGPLPPALLDRLEVIEFSGYVEEEKLEIARRFILPRQIIENGLENEPVEFPDSTVRAVMREYTFEAGVRNLEREIANVCRKVARRKAEHKSIPRRIQPAALHKYLGPPQYSPPETERTDQEGLANGVAWTEGGGDTIVIEVNLLKGKGALQITGQVGEVMQESAQAALSYVRSQARPLGIDESRFEKTDIHIHVPEGGIPKDGPSAGVTIATALASAFTGRKVRSEVAMTGEITLRGRVLPVGGIKEKVLAAHRAGFKTVLLPRKNEKDLVDLPKNVKRDLNLVLTEKMDEVLPLALTPAALRAKRPNVSRRPKPPLKPRPRPNLIRPVAH